MLTHRLFCALSLLTLLGCGTTPGLEDTTGGTLTGFSPLRAGLSQTIDRFLPDSLFPPSNAGVKILSIDRNETLYELNAEMLFSPASNQKLMTGTAALALLGRDYVFSTDISIDTTAPSRIIVHGSGDPTLRMLDLDSIATAIAFAVDHDRDWILTGDISLFDTVSWGSGWMWDDEPGAYVMFVTPLSVDGNSVEISVRSGARIGAPAVAFSVPYSDYVTVLSSVLTAAPTESDSIVVLRPRDQTINNILVSGRIPLGTTYSTRVSLWKPEWYFLRSLSGKLAERGIIVSGMEIGMHEGEGAIILSYQTRLPSVIRQMNKESDNLCAESLFKTIGARTGGLPGTAASARKALMTLWGEWGIDTTRLIIADGSGVSRYDLLSASTLVDLLREVRKDPEISDLVYESLPVAGVDGTLSSRMKGTRAEGNLRAKTGTFTGGSALSGYVTSADGELLAFSILMQNYASSVKPYREVQDSIGVFLSRFRRDDW